jgi:hypothetical protein
MTPTFNFYFQRIKTYEQLKGPQVQFWFKPARGSVKHELKREVKLIHVTFPNPASKQHLL